MQKPVTLAQFGCGYWGPNLLRNFSALPDCRVKYVVEHSAERRAFVVANYPQTIPLDVMETVLADPEVDAVVIATPASTHFDLTKTVLDSGKHVMVEKPMAMTLTDADELTELAAARRRVLMVGHTFLYNDAVAYLRDLVASGDLGQIYYLYAQRLNLGVIRSDVNAMWNLAPHDISIINYILNDQPVSVSATGKAYIQHGIEDVVFMNASFASGVHASVHVSWLDPNKIRQLTVVGSRKMVVYDDIANDKITIYDKGIDRHTQAHPFDDPQPARLVHRSGDISLPQIDFKEPMRTEAKHFLDCVRTGQAPRSDGANGRDVVAVLEAGTRSLASGGAVVKIDGLRSARP